MTKEIERIKETIENDCINSLLDEFKRQGFNTENWDGDDGWEKAIVDGVRNHPHTLPPDVVKLLSDVAKDNSRDNVYQHDAADVLKGLPLLTPSGDVQERANGYAATHSNSPFAYPDETAIKKLIEQNPSPCQINKRRKKSVN